jgi:hypothetical protein
MPSYVGSTFLAERPRRTSWDALDFPEFLDLYSNREVARNIWERCDGNTTVRDICFSRLPAWAREESSEYTGRVYAAPQITDTVEVQRNLAQIAQLAQLGLIDP